MRVENKHKTIYYYAIGAVTLLLALKLFSSKFFENLVDFSITFLPFIIVIATIAAGVFKYRKHPDEIEEIKKGVLSHTLYLLLITLAFYILYSPASFEPIVVSVKKIGRLFSMENYFLALSYISVFIITFSLIYVFLKLYQKSKGTFQGSVKDVAHNTMYSVFFVMAFLFISSIITYPNAYAPVTGLVSNLIFNVFLDKGATVATGDPNGAKIRSLKTVLSDTLKNLKNSVSATSETLVTNITETKTNLDNAISRTNKDLKSQLSDDIEERLDISGGTLSGTLTVEDNLTVEDTATMMDILPDTDDSYDLGSVSKGWDNAYIHTLHGSSILTVGDGSTSHSMSDSDDFLVSGDLEVNGESFFDGASTFSGAAAFDGSFEIGSLTGILEATSGVIGVATAGTDYEVPLTFANSLSRATNTIALVNDVDAPAALYYYGTNASGTKGYFALPSGGTTDHASLLTNLSFDTSGHTGFQREITAGLTLNGNLVLGSYTITTSNTGKISNLNADTTDGYSLNQDVLSSSSPSFAGLTIDNIGFNANTISTSTGDLLLAPDGSSDVNLGGSQLVNIGNNGTDFSSSGGLTLAAALDMNSSVIQNIGSSNTDFDSSGGLALADDLQVNGGDITTSGSVDLKLNPGGDDVDLDGNRLINIGNANTDFDSNGGLALADDLQVNGGDITSSTENISFSNENLSTTGTVDFGAATVDSLSVSDSNITDVGNIALDTITSDQNTISITPGTTLTMNIGTDVGDDFIVGSSLLTVEGDVGQVGIGLADPTSLLELYSSTAHPILTLTGANATDYDPQIQFRTDASPTVKFSAGVDSGDTNATFVDSFKIAPGTAGIGDTSSFVIGSNGITYINSLQSGAQAFPDDAGVTQWIDMSVSDTPAADTVQSYSAMLDGTAALTIYGTADSSGGLTTGPYVGIMNTAPAALLDIGTAGTLGTMRLEGSTSGYTQIQPVATVTSWTMTLPPNDGNSGQQLQTDGAGVTTWAAPESLRSMKNISGTTKPEDALKQILATNVYNFHYKEGMGTQDSETNYVGVMADEAPWAMHFGGTIINPVNTLGYMILGMQAEDEKIVNAQAQIAEIKTQTAGLTLKTDENATTVSGLQVSVDEQLGVISDQLADNSKDIAENKEKLGELEDQMAGLNYGDQILALENKLADIEANTSASVVAEIQEQMKTIQEEYQALMGSVIAMNLDNVIYKDADGNVDLLGGKLVASEVEAGKLVVKITDEKAPTIGSGKIAKFVDEKDADGNDIPDGIDDNDPEYDGTSAVIETGAVSENSKVFVTAKTVSAGSLAVTEIKDGESFTVEVANPVITEDLEFDWWIVEAKDASASE